MAEERQDIFDRSKGYARIIPIPERDATAHGFIDQFAIEAHFLGEIGDALFKDGSIIRGAAAALLGNGQVRISEGTGWMQRSPIILPATTLQFDAAKVSGIDTVYARWLMDKITSVDDPLIAAVATGQPAEDRVRKRVTLLTSSPDAFDEQFEVWNVAETLPQNWTLISGVSGGKGLAKFGRYGWQLNHTTGTQTRAEASIALTPGATYYIYLWLRTVEGQPVLASSAGASIGIVRSSPAFAPAPTVFSANNIYTRLGFSFVADGSTSPVTLFMNIPSGAPTTKLLLDAVLVSQQSLGTNDLDRHYYPLYVWNRQTNDVTQALQRIGQVQQRAWEPPLPGPDIIDIDQNEGLRDFNARGIFAQNGHFRMPGSLLISRNAEGDTSTKLGFRVGGGRAFVGGYEVQKQASTDLLVDRALDAAAVTNEGQTFSFGKNQYGLNKALGVENFTVKQIDAVTAVIESDGTVMPSHTANGLDTMAETGNTVLSVSDGNQAAHTGTVDLTTAVAISDYNNKLVVRVNKYDGTAGQDITYELSRGTFNLDQIIEAFQRGSGPAFRSITIPSNHDWNITFEKDGTNTKLKIRTKMGSTSAALTIQNTSNCLTVLGLTAGTYNGTGALYANPASWKQTGNAIDWTNYSAGNGDGPEPSGQYLYVARRTVTLTANTDYRLGGLFASQVLYYYKIAAWGPSGEGLPSNVVSRTTPAGSINQLTWPQVPQAVSYSVYRSTNGSTYDYLGSVKDPGGTGQVLTFLDDGSQAVNSNIHPEMISTTVNDNPLSSGAGTINTPANGTTNFSSSGTIFINGSDDVTYTGKTSSSFTGCSGVGQQWSQNTPITLGPTMSTVVLQEGELGVLNLVPKGVEPAHGIASGLTINYQYYQHRIDVVAIDKNGVVSVVKGKPADNPAAPDVPFFAMSNGQIKVTADLLAIVIVNNPLLDRPNVIDLNRLAGRVEDLYVNSFMQQIAADMGARVDQSSAPLRGGFYDAQSSHAQHDKTFARGGLIWNAHLDPVHFIVAPPITNFEYTFAVNTGVSTAARVNSKAYLPSTEVALLDQPQWTEWLNLNPYAAYTPPPATILIDPQSLTWSFRASTDEALNALLEALRKELYGIAGGNPPRPGIRMTGNVRVLVNGQEYTVKVQHGTPVDRENVERAIARVRKIIEDAIANSASPDKIYLQTVTIRIIGQYFAASEANIRAKFAGQYVDFTATGTTSQGTSQGSPAKTTVNADGAGRFSGQIVIPGDIASGIYDVEAIGPTKSAKRSFEGIVSREDPLAGLRVVNKVKRCPLAQSFSFSTDRTLSGVSVWLDYIDRGQANAPTEPIEVQLQRMIAGLPSGDVVASKVLNPATDITWGGETKVLFDDYLVQPGLESYCVALFTHGSKYLAQVAKLGGIGKNPAAILTEQAYRDGVLFASSNDETWTPLQEYDLRFKIWGRSFSPTGTLQLNSVNTDNLTDLLIAVEQFAPVGSTIEWEYELNGASSVIYQAGTFDKIAAQTVTPITSIILRAKLSSNSVNSSSVIDLNSLKLHGYKNAIAGTYISRLVKFAQNITKATLIYGAYLPASTSVAAYVSTDDGTTWTAVSGSPASGWPKQVDSFFKEYQFPVLTVPSGKDFRLRLEMTAPNPAMVVPVVGQIAVVLQ